MSVNRTQYPTQHEHYAKNTVPAIILEATENVTAILKSWSASDYENFDWTDADVVFEGSYAPDFNSEINIDFKDLYAADLEAVIPTTSPYTQGTNRKYYRCNLYDDNATLLFSMSWFVCNALYKGTASFQTWSTTNFLTNQPLEKPTTKDSPEWLTWLDLNGTDVLKVKFYFKTGSNTEITVLTNSTVGIISADVSYKTLIQLASVLSSSLLGYYDLILYNDKDTELCRQRYIYMERTGREKYFMFVNALGGIDTLICQGANTLSPELTYNIGRFGDTYDLLDDVDEHRRWQQATGPMPRRWSSWIWELLATKGGAAKYDNETDTTTTIIITDGSLSMSDHGQLSDGSFGYIATEPISVVSVTERATDRSLHQSTADSSEELEDLTTKVTLAFTDDGQGNYETEVATILSTKLYVEFETTDESATIAISVDGTMTGDFDPSVDSSPLIITKGASETIQFSTQDDVLSELVISYYPIITNV